MIKQTKLAQVLEVLEENPHLIEIVQVWAQAVYPHLATPPAQPHRKPLTVQEIAAFVGTHQYGSEQLKWFRLGEAAHNIKP
jgi:hypothetical protein